MYYEKLIKELNENNTFDRCLSKIINPFSLYYLCDHYYGGKEVESENITFILEDKNDLLKSNDLSKIKDFDIIHCQVDYFEKFCNEILHKIQKKFILTTGQYNLPQIQKSKIIEKILNNENVILWISQNPIYDNIGKYIAFPYGIRYDKLQQYAYILINNSSLKKTKELLYLPVGITNECRKKLPMYSDYLNVSDFYKTVQQGKFLISPIGDRDDCYRHYEAIGLGTIPISNVNCFYKNIFKTNMIYADIDEMVKIIEEGHVNYIYEEPNKDLICFEYYRDIVNKIIEKHKQLQDELVIFD